MYDKNITTEDFAKMIGCTRATIARILRGIRPGGRTQYKINLVLGENVFPLKEFDEHLLDQKDSCHTSDNNSKETE